MIITDIQSVFHWLGKDAENVPYHLRLLNLRWSAHGRDADLCHYANLAQELKHMPNLITRLIRDDNWRANLIGNTVVMLLNASDFRDDLVWRLLQRS